MSKLFKELTPVHTAQTTFLNTITPVNRTETLPIEDCCNRVLTKEIIAQINVPHYMRAAMDGYALRAKDTLAASTTSPVILHESDTITPQSCVHVHTGSLLPDGADAVIMVEDTQRLDNNLIEITAQLHPHENVGEIGEDIRKGELVFRQNHTLHPVDVSVLANLQVTHATVYQKPTVSVIPTGNELIPRNSKQPPKEGEIIETNSLMVGLYVEKWGGKPIINNIVPDKPELIKQAIVSNLSSDMIILCGGTSVGDRDQVPAAIERLGTILIRGIKASPGKPTTLAAIKNTPIICMPGYPVAGYVTLQLFAKPAIKTLAHQPHLPENMTTLPLAEKIASKAGYLTFARVKIENGTVKPIMSSGASILSSIARSDGYIMIPEEIEGYSKGEQVTIILAN
ncbi:MAG: hypothetical protein DIAAKJNI_00115 [Candidatus Argoarchaeum ethanivorans]|uniref:MoaB/Mog domain-containing protein n=1 Tax=Candidatus Argoarchaeum ethanivorans TaxID=2608793 RepID=A0A811T754_9EURY|nr:MAG: hypothetical protein DIAAKJNI_00115 [Candidatus Argoarchaeum ethanivorans]